MKLSSLFAPAVSGLALLSGSAAFAQVTAQDVWDNWSANLGLYSTEGVTIGSEDYTGGVLTVTDVAINFADAEGTATALLGNVTMTEQGDGTVLVTMSEEIPLTMTGPATEGTGEMTMDMTVTQAGLQMLVSGTPEAMVYDITADSYGLLLNSLTDGAVSATGGFVMNGVAGSYSVETTDMQALAYDLAATSVDLSLDIDDPTQNLVLSFAGAVTDIATSATMVTPLPENTTPETVLMDGLAGEAGYTYSSGAFTFDATQDGLPVTGTLAIGQGGVDFVASADGIGYSSLTEGLTIEAMSDMMPFPVQISLAQYGFDLLMPLSATDEPVDFALGVNLTELAINEEIWAMLDPSAMLPRDPASLIIDITGTARLLIDLADPAQAAAAASMAAPGELHSLSLNDLTLIFGGAQITGTGAFTFDNADTTTIPGIPRPEGKLDLRADGINGLIDTLVAMGLLPEDQVMGARMMLGLFTVPVGDDQLTSTIEVNAEGHVLANGQRLQ